jgi:hypothetical protein
LFEYDKNVSFESLFLCYHECKSNFKEEVIIILNIIGYILGVGFVVFGISAVYFLGYEIYKIISKSEKKVSYKSTIYLAVLAAICGLILIVMANMV